MKSLILGAALVLGLGLWTLPASSGDRIEVAHRALEQLSTIDDAAYLVDRARRLSGRVLDDRWSPVVAECRLADAVQHRQALEAAAGSGEAGRLLEVGVPCELSFATDGGGRFSVQPDLGNKTLFVTAEGFRPTRLPDVLVRDGVANDGLIVRLEAPDALEVLVGADAADGQQVRPVYRGWWPDDDWAELEPGSVLRLERRDPDGFPVLLAVRDGSGLIHWRSVPLEASTAPSLTLADLPEWTGLSTTSWGPELGRHDAVVAIDALHKGTSGASWPATGDATLSLRLPHAYSLATVESGEGTRLGVLTDAYGEVHLHGLTPGPVTVSATASPGLTTRSRGAVLAAHTSTSLRFHYGDVLQPEWSQPGTYALVGLLTAAGRPVPEGILLAEPLDAGSGSRRPLRATADEFGFYRLQGLVGGASYMLWAFSSPEIENYRWRGPMASAVPRGQGAELRFDIELSGTQLEVLVGETGPGDRLRVIHGGEGGPWIPVYDQVIDGRTIVLNDLPLGDVELQWRGEDDAIRTSATSRLSAAGQHLQIDLGSED